MLVPGTPMLRVILSVLVLFAAAVGTYAAQQAPIVQPGAPGSSSRVITAVEASDLSAVGYTSDDIKFMQGMIAHHKQALEMTALRPARSRADALRLLVLRIELSQTDEIKAMEQWLTARGVPLAAAHANHGGAAAAPMPGMLTAEEMARLAKTTGTAFDRLFLELMIKHHEGALLMVEQLFGTPGAGQESAIFAFASDVVDDQRAEIARMTALLK